MSKGASKTDVCFCDIITGQYISLSFSSMAKVFSIQFSLFLFQHHRPARWSPLVLIVVKHGLSRLLRRAVFIALLPISLQFLFFLGIKKDFPVLSVSKFEGCTMSEGHGF